MPYPKNFVARALVCFAGTLALFMMGRYIGLVLIRHEPFSFDASDIIAPAIVGIAEAKMWKPKKHE